MRIQSLIENIEFELNALKRIVPKSVLIQYRNNEFDSVLTTPGAAINLFRVATNQVKNDGTLVKIVKILLPYMLRDLGDMFGTEKSAKEAYKLIYNLVYKTTEYDEWKPAIPAATLAKFLDDHKKEIVKLTLKEFKEFMNYGGGSGHPSTIRLATILRRLQMIVDWPELKPIYLGLHNYVFDNINNLAAERNYNAEHNLIDYISRNHVDLNQFPKIREQLNNKKEKILLAPISNNDDIERSMSRLKLWLETLKDIGLDWPELNDAQTVYDLAKPIVIKRLLIMLKNDEQYSALRTRNAVGMLKNFFKISWPELDVIEKSIKQDNKDLYEGIWPFDRIFHRMPKDKAERYIEMWKRDPIATIYTMNNRYDAVVDHPMLEKFVNEHRAPIVKEILTLIRDDFDDELYSLMYALDDIGVKWPEFDAIKKSIEADKGKGYY